MTKRLIVDTDRLKGMLIKNSQHGLLRNSKIILQLKEKTLLTVLPDETLYIIAKFTSTDEVPYKRRVDSRPASVP